MIVEGQDTGQTVMVFDSLPAVAFGGGGSPAVRHRRSAMISRYSEDRFQTLFAISVRCTAFSP